MSEAASLLKQNLKKKGEAISSIEKWQTSSELEMHFSVAAIIRNFRPSIYTQSKLSLSSNNTLIKSPTIKLRIALFTARKLSNSIRRSSYKLVKFPKEM